MAKDPTPALHLTLPQARRAWIYAQGLGASGALLSLPGGWLRAIGGTDPYLCLRNRVASSSRMAIDTALAEGELWVVPGVRGCIWLTSAADVSLVLTVGDAQYQKRTRREMDKLGVGEGELRALGDAILTVIEAGPMTPDALRGALPEGTWRSLGEAGKKMGHTTTLPAALRVLEGEGKVRRLQEGGGLDSQRYLWALADINPLTLGAPPQGEAAQAEALARHFFSNAGPATEGEFVGWSALTKTLARKAMAAVGLVPVAVEGVEGMSWVLPGQEDAARLAPASEGAFFLPGLDNIFSLRAAPALFADPVHHDVPLLNMMGSKAVPMGELSWMTNRPVLIDGDWLGIWEWDQDAERVRMGAFGEWSADQRAKAMGEAEALTAYIRDELGGSCKAHGIDGEKSRGRRLAVVAAREVA